MIQQYNQTNRRVRPFGRRKGDGPSSALLESGCAVIHTHYLDRHGREQKIATHLSQAVAEVMEQAKSLRSLTEQYLHSIGGQVLSVQLEILEPRCCCPEEAAEPESARVIPFPDLRPFPLAEDTGNH